MPLNAATVTLSETLAESASGASITAFFSDHSGGTTADWIGVYRDGQTPGGPSATWWSYVDGTQAAGSLNLGGRFANPNNSALGLWKVHFLSNDGYSPVPGADPVGFEVIPASGISFSADQAIYPMGAPVTLNWSGNAGVTATDWVGVYPQGGIPGPDPSLDFNYVPTESGSTSFENLDPGNYDIYFLANDGYYQLGMASITVIPEPSAFLVGASGILLMLRRRRPGRAFA